MATYNVSVSSGLKASPSPAAVHAAWSRSVSSGLGLSAGYMPYLGRYRQGDVIPLTFTAPEIPNAVPTMIVTNSSGSTVLTTSLWTWDGGVTFQYGLLVDARFVPGRFTCAVTFIAADHHRYFLQQQFDAVAGGDADSSVISLYEHESAFGRFVLAQTRSGKLVVGQGPWV